MVDVGAVLSVFVAPFIQHMTTQTVLTGCALITAIVSLSPLLPNGTLFVPFLIQRLIFGCFSCLMFVYVPLCVFLFIFFLFACLFICFLCVCVCVFFYFFYFACSVRITQFRKNKKKKKKIKTPVFDKKYIT